MSLTWSACTNTPASRGDLRHAVSAAEGAASRAARAGGTLHADPQPASRAEWPWLCEAREQSLDNEFPNSVGNLAREELAVLVGGQAVVGPQVPADGVRLKELKLLGGRDWQRG